MMVDNEGIYDILSDLNNNPNVITSLLFSRSGMYIAGQPPEGVHLETFVAMAAVLLSAAETASSGFREVLESVIVRLDRSMIIIDRVSKKGGLVVVTNSNGNHDYLQEPIKEVIRELAILI
jgi:predicted regulator of Ras-like GTPase activity (Roadblock/LC7/MglB family)